MQHLTNSLFFGRLPNGDVRILKFTTMGLAELGISISSAPNVTTRYPTHVVEFDSIIESDDWVSIVALMSHSGKTAARYFEAQRFHNE